MLSDASRQRADAPAAAAAYWPLPIARAVPAAATAIWITFSADHSAALGLRAFGAFAVVSGLAVSGIAWRRLAESGSRPYLVAQGLISVALGVAAFVSVDGGVAALFLVVTTWAALTGALELYSGYRARGRFLASGDWMTVGALTALLALALVLIPPDFSEQFVGEEQVSGVLDSAIVAVGVLGAYAAIVAVYLTIAGLSAMWASRAASDAAAGETVAESEIGRRS